MRDNFASRASGARARAKAPSRWREAMPIAIALAATLYFAGLAFVNAHGHSVGYALVAVAEILILLAALGFVAATGFRDRDVLPLAYMFAFTVLMVAISLANDTIFPDPLRNAAIVTLFTMIGVRCSPSVLDRAFWFAALAVAAGLAIELASTPLYVWLFQPALFFQSFRGLTVASYNDTGLFGPALGFENRFGFGLFSHRTSSLMMEQVSLANFASVSILYVITRWEALSRYRRAFFIVLAIASVATNSARAASVFCLTCWVGYFVFPRLPRFGTLALAPAMLIGSFVLIAINGLTVSDTLLGRVGVTVQFLSRFDVQTWTGQSIAMTWKAGDSGIAYLVLSSSVAGLILVWLYSSLVIPQTTTAQKRCAYGLSLFLFMNLLVSGTAVFSMKTAALLWLLAGFISVQSAQVAPTESRLPVRRRLALAPA